MIELCRQMVCFDNYRALQRDWLGGGGRFTLSAITFLPAPGFIVGGRGGVSVDRTLILHLQYHTMHICYVTQAQSSVFHSHIKVGMTDICSQGTQPFTYNHTMKRPSVIHFLCFLLTIWNTETLVSFCMSNTSTVPYHMLKDRALLSPVQFNTKFKKKN